jgi:soluble lytic murein transglycosylase-like protein
VSPEQAEAFMKAAAEERAAFTAEEQASETPEEPKKPGKGTKAADKKAKEVAAAVVVDKPLGVKAQDGRAEKTAKAAKENEAETDDQTASLPDPATSLVLKSRQSDAARALALKPLIARYALDNELPYELADAVIRLESRYNAAARRGANMGLMQINLLTARSLGYEGAAAGLLDAETNLRYGLKYLAKAYKLASGDVCGALLRFQFGHRAQTTTGASRAYCAKVKVIAAAAE